MFLPREIPVSQHNMHISLNLIYYVHKTYADGSHPILLQYTVNRKVKRKVLARCQKKDWDPDTRRLRITMPNANAINQYIENELLNAERDLYEIRSGQKPRSEIFKSKPFLSIGKALDRELIRMQLEYKSGQYDKVLGLKRQIRDINIDIQDIDREWILALIYDFREKGNIGSTIQKKVKLLRSVIARYSERGVTREHRNIRIPVQKSIKIKLTRREIHLIENLQLPVNDLITAARDLFILQIYLRGIRIGDILQAYSSDFENDRFFYYDDKTNKRFSLKIIDPARPIIDRYKGKHQRLFPFFSWKPNEKLTAFENERRRLKHKESCTTIVNKHLKVIAGMTGITKPLSSHVARHTFARMAIDKINNPMITMELLGHTSLAIHQQYLKDLRQEEILDDAADDIFSEIL